MAAEETTRSSSTVGNRQSHHPDFPHRMHQEPETDTRTSWYSRSPHSHMEPSHPLVSRELCHPPWSHSFILRSRQNSAIPSHDMGEFLESLCDTIMALPWGKTTLAKGILGSTIAAGGFLQCQMGLRAQ